MSAISTILTRLRAAIWAIDVRDDIANAIEQCYSDVSNPTLKTEALEAALQTKIDEGEMAALTIGDHTITAAKLAQGVIDNTLATSGAAADAKKTGDEIAAVKADLDTLADITPIPDNSDLNDYVETGLYSVEYGSYTILNYPPVAVAASYLEVRRLTTGYVGQKLTIPGNGKVFTRRKFNNGKWNDWIQIAEISNDLMTQGKAADSKKTGDEIAAVKADLGDVTEFSRYHPLYDYLVLDGDGRVLYDYSAPVSPDEITQLERYYPYTLILDKDGYVVFTDKKETVNPLEGLKVSIIGDSISSYEGWVPTGYATYYPRDDVSVVDYMWWKQLLQKSGMKLCVNASWSGSRLGYDITTATNSYSAASDGRIADLVNPDTEETPDIIICYICTNDWGHSTPIGEYSSKMAIPFNGAVTNISQGYALMLYKIRNTYPDALVYCVTHLDGRHSTSGDEDYPIQDDLGQTLHEVNHMIIELAHVFGARVIDLETCGVHPWNISEYTVDGHLHPNKKGHALIADTMYRQIKHDFE